MTESTNPTTDTPPDASAVIRIRLKTPADKSFILSLAPRLAAVGVPPWRDPAHALGFHQETTVEAVLATDPEAAVFIAEDESGQPVGFIHVIAAEDFLTREPQGYVSDIAVTADAEGTGVGQALMAAAEAWVREQGYRILTLETFAVNSRARSLFDRLGYQPETIRYAKTL